MSKQHVFFEHTLYTLQVDNSMLKNMHHHHVYKMDQTQNNSIFFCIIINMACSPNLNKRKGFYILWSWGRWVVWNLNILTWMQIGSIIFLVVLQVIGFACLCICSSSLLPKNHWKMGNSKIHINLVYFFGLEETWDWIHYNFQTCLWVHPLRCGGANFNITFEAQKLANIRQKLKC
jgi:hypothetical protein